MAQCQCGVELTGKRRKCDACKGRSTVARELASSKSEPAAPAEAAPVVDVPPGLHARGRALWATLGQSLSSPAGQVALEACRSADRLDELDSIIAGKGVLNLMQFRLHEHWGDEGDRTVAVEVKFQAVLTEARQQQANFKTLLAEISDVVPVAPPGPAVVVKKSPLDELAERRAQKQ